MIGVQSSRSFSRAQLGAILGKKCPQSRPSNPHGPFGFWIGISLRARVRPEPVTKEIGCWKFPLESTSTVAVFSSFVSSIFFVKVCTHFKIGWILYVVDVDVVVICSLLALEPLKVDSIPTRLDGRSRDFSPRGSSHGARENCPKESRACLKRKNLVQNNKFPLLLIVGRFSRDVIELYFVKHSK